MCSTCVACRGINLDLEKGGQQPSPGVGSRDQHPDPSHNDLYGHEELWDNELIQLAPTLQVQNALSAECCLLHLAKCFATKEAELASPGCCHVTPHDSPPICSCSSCSGAGHYCMPAGH